MRKKHFIGAMLAFGCLLPSLAICDKMELISLQDLGRTALQVPVALAGLLGQAAESQEDLRAPELYEVAHGALLEPGQSGRAVVLVKRLLMELDYPVRPGDFFDKNLSEQIGHFQEEQELAQAGDAHWGKVGSATLSRLRERVTWAMYDPTLGEGLAKYARGHASGGQSFCYYYVARAIHAYTRPFLEGLHAYMAADLLAESKSFREVRVAAKALDKLPAGAIVVWDKGNSRSGHISIADGSGQEISDHVSRQMISHYGGAGHRVFLPVAEPKFQQAKALQNLKPQRAQAL